jgi:hypothetical protein
MNVTLDAAGNPTYAGSSDNPIPSSTRAPRDREKRAKLETALTQVRLAYHIISLHASTIIHCCF